MRQTVSVGSSLLPAGFVTACSASSDSCGSPVDPSPVPVQATTAAAITQNSTSPLQTGADAAATLVPVCQVTGDGSYALLEIDASAKQAHLDHGDGVPLGTVPTDTTGALMFDDLCHILGPAIDIEKLTNGQDADNGSDPKIPVGGQVTWDYVVTNTGDVDLDNINVVDDDPAIGRVCQLTLPAGMSLASKVLGTAVAGRYTNVGSVTANFTAPGGTISVGDSDPSHYVGQADDPADPGGGGGSIKVDMCHKTGQRYMLLSVEKDAEPDHLGHGDGHPLMAVPLGGPTGTFNQDCSIS